MWRKTSKTLRSFFSWKTCSEETWWWCSNRFWNHLVHICRSTINSFVTTNLKHGPRDTDHKYLLTLIILQVYTKSTGTFGSPLANEVEEHKCPIRSSAIGENTSLFHITFMVIWSLSGSSILVDFGWSRVARVVFVWLQWLLVHLGPLDVVVDGGVVHLGHLGPSTGSWLRPTCKRRHGGDVYLRCNICIFVGKWSLIFLRIS